MSTEDEAAEIAAVLRKAAREHIGLTEGEFWPSTIADAQVDALADLLAARDRRVRAEGHREGYETARGDLVSGAFIGGPTYEALKASFTGRQIAKDALREAAAALEPTQECVDQWLRDRADQFEADA